MKGNKNKFIRDEDGKTPLDKARERSDDGHHEVANLLQSPGVFLLQDSGKTITAFGSTAVLIRMFLKCFLEFIIEKGGCFSTR